VFYDFKENLEPFAVLNSHIMSARYFRDYVGVSYCCQPMSASCSCLL